MRPLKPYQAAAQPSFLRFRKFPVGSPRRRVDDRARRVSRSQKVTDAAKIIGHAS